MCSRPVIETERQEREIKGREREKRDETERPVEKSLFLPGVPESMLLYMPRTR